MVVIDDVDALDPASARALAHAVAAGRANRCRRAAHRSPSVAVPPDDADKVRRTFLDLWMDGFARRIDLSSSPTDDHGA